MRIATIKFTFFQITLMGFGLFAYAQSTPINPGGDQTPVNPGGSGAGLHNPLGNKDLAEFLQDILEVVMVFAIPLIVFMILYAGFMYVTAQGDAKKVGDAHKALLYAVIGGVIIIGANVILAVIQGTVDAFRT